MIYDALYSFFRNIFILSFILSFCKFWGREELVNFFYNSREKE